MSVPNLSADPPSPGQFSKTTREEVESFLNDIRVAAISLKRAASANRDAGGSTPSAANLLRTLQRHGPLTVPQMGRLQGTSRQNIQVMVNRLVAEGCVELSENPAHKRSCRVSLTEAGQALVGRSEEPQSRVIDLLLGGVSEMDLAGGIRVLRELRRLLAAKRLKDESGPVGGAVGSSRGRRQTMPSAEKRPEVQRGGEQAGVGEDEFPVSLL